MTEGSLVARCPAKVNLCLRVLFRRDDGYHELDTVFQTIDIWDTIEVRPGEGLSLECGFPGVPTDSSNLVLRAAARLREGRTRPVAGASIVLRKSIPVWSGLGGGSSDAAGALLLLDRFWGLETGADRLTDLARSLGADVTYFLTGGTARGRGRGDQIEPLPHLGNVPVLLGFPPFGLSTTEVFGRYARKLTPPGKAVSLPIFSTHKWPEGNDFGFMVNDLERVVFEGWPVLRTFRDALLEAGARMALLSGSGSTVYGMFRECGDLDQAAGILRRRFPKWTVLSTRTIEGAARIVEMGNENGFESGYEDVGEPGQGGLNVEITQIRVFPVEEEKLKAFVSVIFDECFVVSDIKIIQGVNGLFVSMPSKKRKNGTFRDIAHPLNNETRRRFEEEIIARYREVVSGSGGTEPAPLRELGANACEDDSSGSGDEEPGES